MTVSIEQLEDYSARLQPFITLVILANLLLLWLVVLSFLPAIVPVLGLSEPSASTVYSFFNLVEQAAGILLGTGVVLCVAQAVLRLQAAYIQKREQKTKDDLAV